MENDQYVVYERRQDGAHVIAMINGNVIDGPGAEMIRRALKDAGWPVKGAPDILLHGTYVWAAKVQR